MNKLIKGLCLALGFACIGTGAYVAGENVGFNSKTQAIQPEKPDKPSEGNEEENKKLFKEIDISGTELNPSVSIITHTMKKGSVLYQQANTSSKTPALLYYVKNDETKPKLLLKKESPETVTALDNQDDLLYFAVNNNTTKQYSLMTFDCETEEITTIINSSALITKRIINENVLINAKVDDQEAVYKYNLNTKELKKLIDGKHSFSCVLEKGMLLTYNSAESYYLNLTNDTITQISSTIPFTSVIKIKDKQFLSTGMVKGQGLYLFDEETLQLAEEPLIAEGRGYKIIEEISNEDLTYITATGQSAGLYVIDSKTMQATLLEENKAEYKHIKTIGDYAFIGTTNNSINTLRLNLTTREIEKLDYRISGFLVDVSEDLVLMHNGSNLMTLNKKTFEKTNIDTGDSTSVILFNTITEQTFGDYKLITKDSTGRILAFNVKTNEFKLLDKAYNSLEVIENKAYAIKNLTDLTIGGQKYSATAYSVFNPETCEFELDRIEYVEK